MDRFSFSEFTERAIELCKDNRITNLECSYITIDPETTDIPFLQPQDSQYLRVDAQIENQILQTYMFYDPIRSFVQCFFELAGTSQALEHFLQGNKFIEFEIEKIQKVNLPQLCKHVYSIADCSIQSDYAAVNNNPGSLDLYQLLSLYLKNFGIFLKI